MIRNSREGGWPAGKRQTSGLALLAFLIILAAGGYVLWQHLNQEVTVSRDGFSMNTVIRISVTGKEKTARLALEESFVLLERLNDELSLYREGSTLSKINARAGEEALPVSPDVFAAVSKAREACQLTGGVFNPLSGPITKLWKINQSPDEPEAFTLPERASLDAALALTGPDGLELVPAPEKDKGGSVRLVRRGAALDLGGIAKGYASTRIVELLHTRGISSALVNLGGNVHVLGMNKGVPWNIGIRNPMTDSNEPVALVLSISDEERKGMAVVTSGGYERYRVVDGVRYSHFFDPRTGMPVQNDLLSATVVTADGAMADALDTAFMIMGSERAMSFLTPHPELGAVLIRRNAAGGLDILVTENLRGKIRRPLVKARFF